MRNKFMYILLTTIIALTSCNNRLNEHETKIDETKTTIETSTNEDTLKVNVLDTVDIIVPEKDTNKVVGKYIKVVEYEIDDVNQEETIVLTKGNEYLIGSNSNDIFIYFYKQVNTTTKKNMKLKFIENGKAISYKCEKDEVHHLKIMKVSSMDKKDPYIVTIHYVNPKNN